MNKLTHIFNIVIAITFLVYASVMVFYLNKDNKNKTCESKNINKKSSIVLFIMCTLWIAWSVLRIAFF